MQIINFHDDEELQCHMSVTAIEMIIKTKQTFRYFLVPEAQAVKGSEPFSGEQQLNCI